jgi:YesN/AraC family two-component response regulator
MELTVLRNDNDITDPRIDIAIHYISKHFSERITIKMIADMTNMTPSYFGILFKKIMGINFNQYLIQTRIQKAEKMLASGNYKVTNIPEACGFTDISHFYKLFKVVRGFPPSYCKPKKVKLT